MFFFPNFTDSYFFPIFTDSYNFIFNDTRSSGFFLISPGVYILILLHSHLPIDIEYIPLSDGHSV